MKPSEKLQLAHVKRWNIINTTRTQTVAEHSALVQFIAMDVLRLYSPKALPELQLATMRWALWHDLPEVFTGDIPTPCKDLVEDKCPGVFDQIDNTIEEYHAIKAETPEVAVLIVKFADLFEAINFLREHAAGPRAEQVMYQLGHRLSEFIDQVESGFHKSLARAFTTYIEEFPDD